MSEEDFWTLKEESAKQKFVFQAFLSKIIARYADQVRKDKNALL